MDNIERTDRISNNGNYGYQPAYSPVTLKEWMLTFLLLCIPLMNIILLFTWAFSGNAHPSKANWAKAALVWMAIMFVIYIIFIIIFASIFSEFLKY